VDCSHPRLDLFAEVTREEAHLLATNRNEWPIHRYLAIAARFDNLLQATRKERKVFPVPAIPMRLTAGMPGSINRSAAKACLTFFVSIPNIWREPATLTAMGSSPPSATRANADADPGPFKMRN